MVEEVEEGKVADIAEEEKVVDIAAQSALIKA